MTSFLAQETQPEGSFDLHHLFDGSMVVLVVCFAVLGVWFYRKWRLAEERSKHQLVDYQHHLQNEERLRTTLNATPFPIIIVRQGDYRIRKFNYVAHEILALDQTNLEQTFLDTCITNQEEFQEIIPRVEKTGLVRDLEIQLLNRSGQAFWALTSIIPLNFEDEEMFLIGFSDISRQKELEEELRRQAMTDMLTGLSSRRYFLEDADSEFARSLRYERTLTLLLFDIDHFKRVNDTYGHATGDDVLIAIGAIIKEVIRNSDHPGRIGGEEFAVLLPETPVEQAYLVAARLADRVRGHTFRSKEGDEIKVTISIGLTDIRASDTGISSAMARADELLYRAKAEGRDRICVEGAMPENATGEGAS